MIYNNTQAGFRKYVTRSMSRKKPEIIPIKFDATSEIDLKVEIKESSNETINKN